MGEVKGFLREMVVVAGIASACYSVVITGKYLLCELDLAIAVHDIDYYRSELNKQATLETLQNRKLFYYRHSLKSCQDLGKEKM